MWGQGGVARTAPSRHRAVRGPRCWPRYVRTQRRRTRWCTPQSHTSWLSRRLPDRPTRVRCERASPWRAACRVARVTPSSTGCRGVEPSHRSRAASAGPTPRARRGGSKPERRRRVEQMPGGSRRRMGYPARAPRSSPLPTASGLPGIRFPVRRASRHVRRRRSRHPSGRRPCAVLRSAHRRSWPTGRCAPRQSAALA